MADVTNLFKATVKAVKSSNKLQKDSTHDQTQNSIFPAVKQRGDFESKARDVVNSISKLRDFLLQHRKEYVNAGSLLAGHLSTMTDAERDQIDNDAQAIIKKCRETIQHFRTEAESFKVHPQVKEHRNAVIFLIEIYLKGRHLKASLIQRMLYHQCSSSLPAKAVCKIYSEQKAVRVKRIVDRKKISRLEPDKTRSHVSQLQTLKDTSNESGAGKKGLEVPQNLKPARPQSVELSDKAAYEEETDFSPEEAQMFEQENRALFEEMNSMVEDVRQIEGKVVEIAKLQEIFTEKILDQDKQIDTISTTVVGTSVNIKDANEEIREAIKKKAEFRVWILFFLVVCSFSLLFLDWYNG